MVAEEQQLLKGHWERQPFRYFRFRNFKILGSYFSWTVRQANNIEVSVSPQVCNAELAVVDGGEHVQQFST